MTESDLATGTSTKTEPRAGVAPALALLCGALGSLLPGWAGAPVALYDPVGRSLRFAPIGAQGAPPVEITFYGVYLWCAFGALLGAVIGIVIDRSSTLPRAHPLLSAWSLTALGVATAYQLWNVWP